LEGYDLVQKQIERALSLRYQVNNNAQIKKYFHFLGVTDMIPDSHRSSGETLYLADTDGNWDTDFLKMWKAWRDDEFVLDPCRLTLHTGKSGIDGDTFKNEYLMDQYEIQVNKTAINSVLFMTTIGTTRSSVAYLLESLVKISHQLDNMIEEFTPLENRAHQAKVLDLTEKLPPLPNFSHFHAQFRSNPTTESPEGNIRAAFFMAYNEEGCEYIRLEDKRWEDISRQYVAANFVIPYPPGFPILVPGQVVSQSVISFMKSLDVKEIHGYQQKLGIRVFKKETLEKIVFNFDTKTYHFDI